MRGYAVLGTIATLLISAPAMADTDRGDQSSSKSIVTHEFNIKQGGKTLRAKVDYVVSVTYNWYEAGNANFPDDRSCHFRPRDRVLMRTITLTDPSTQKERNVGTYRIVVPVPQNYDYSGNGSYNNCNSRAGEMSHILNDGLGDVTTWKSYIDGDITETQNVLSLFGAVSQLS